MKNIAEAIYELMQSKKEGVLITVISKKGSGPALPGAKMIVYPDGNTLGTVGGGELEKIAGEKAIKLSRENATLLESFTFSDSETNGATGMVCGGTATLYFEYYPPQTQIYIFGAGHIGKALAYHLRPLSYHVILIDDRKELLDSNNDADQKIHHSFTDLFSKEKPQPNSYFVIATYNHQYDGLILNRIFKESWQPAYVGVVASRRKRSILQEALLAEAPDADLDKCYLPAGLDTGGGTPHEIALSIVSEIQTILNNKQGVHLRE
jgi:xanthine dehydrogenase accessory factor